MKVSERVKSLKKAPDGFNSWLFTAINPETGKPELLCSEMFRRCKEEDYKKWDWDVEKEFLTESEIEEFKTKFKTK